MNARGLVLGLLTACLGASASGAPSLEDTAAQLDALKGEMRTLELWLERNAGNQTELDRALQRADTALAAQARASREADAALAMKTAEVAALSTEVADTTAAEQAQRAALGEAVRGAWLLSRRPPLQLLLEGEAPDELGRLLTFQSVLASHYADAAATLQATLQTLEAQRTQLAAEQAALTLEQQRARAEENRLAQARDENASALARFRQRLSAQTARRDALSQDAEALGKLLARLKDEATKRRFEVRPGALPWPLEGRILHAFGAPLPPAMARANGLQLGARAGTPVRAVASGEVVFSNWLRGFGLMIIVDHGAGWLSLYGQAESLLYGEGQRVEAGEVIATAGRSGGAAATGLWFELRQNGTPQDPLRWCLARS